MPWQEFVQTRRRMIGDAGEHVCAPQLFVERRTTSVFQSALHRLCSSRVVEQFELRRSAVQDGCGTVCGGRIGTTLRDLPAASRGLQRILRCQFRRRLAHAERGYDRAHQTPSRQQVKAAFIAAGDVVDPADRRWRNPAGKNAERVGPRDAARRRGAGENIDGSGQRWAFDAYNPTTPSDIPTIDQYLPTIRPAAVKPTPYRSRKRQGSSAAHSCDRRYGPRLGCRWSPAHTARRSGTRSA